MQARFDRFFSAAVRVFFLLAILASLPLAAQSIAGDWYGKLVESGQEFRLVLHVKPAGTGFTITMDSLEEEDHGLPVAAVAFRPPDFSFQAEFGIRYAGRVNAAGTEILGVWEQGGRKWALNFGRTPIAAPPFSPEDIRRKYSKRETYIAMRDGVKLFTSIYAPKNDATPRPILLLRTTYNIEPGGPDKISRLVQEYRRFLAGNYVLAFQDVRGRFMSQGVFEHVRPFKPRKRNRRDSDESTDAWDTVDWLVRNVRNNNGRVGVHGISYPGFFSTMALIGAHPAVKAVSPQAPIADWFLGDDAHHNGALCLLDATQFLYWMDQPRERPTRNWAPQFTDLTADNYEFFLSLGAVDAITAKYFSGRSSFWNEVIAHPDYDDFWKARNPLRYLKNVRPAVMTVGGWFDAEDLYGTLHTYRAIEDQNPPTLANRLVMGPWYHHQWGSAPAHNVGNVFWGLDANEKFLALEERFFNHYLKGEGSEDMAEATVFVTGANEWREYDAWPPRNAGEKNLYLRSGGGASFEPPTGEGDYDEYVSDPMKPVPYTEDVHARRTREYMTDDQRFAARRPDVMVYQTEVLGQDVTFAGPLVADLFVSTTGRDADYVVKLIDVFPPDTDAGDNDRIKVPLGGYQMLVRGEVFRGRYRNGFEKPQPFEPGAVAEVKFAIPDVAHTFKKGHRIMVQVQNSWFPLVDRNPQKFVDIYHCSDGDFQKATQRIYHDRRRPSHLRARVLE
jgi:putative CocE/NonD family hydrolase